MVILGRVVYADQGQVQPSEGDGASWLYCSNDAEKDFGNDISNSKWRGRCVELRDGAFTPEEIDYYTSGSVALPNNRYGKDWRIWQGIPTQKQMEDAPWADFNAYTNPMSHSWHMEEQNAS